MICVVSGVPDKPVGALGGVGELRGVFSLNSPNRPNGIGLSILRLLGIQGNLLHVDNVDMLDGTPILDIKPYKPQDYPRV